MTKRTASLGVQTQRELYKNLKPLGFKYKKNSNYIINTIDNIEFEISLHGASWPNSCVRSLCFSFKPLNFNNLLDKIHCEAGFKDEKSYWRDYICTLNQITSLFKMGALNVQEYKINSSEDAKAAADNIRDYLTQNIFKKTLAYKNPYFIEYLKNCDCDGSLHRTRPDNYLMAKMIDNKRGNKFEEIILKNLPIWEETNKKTYDLTKGYMDYLKLLTQEDLWKQINLENTLDIKLEALILLLAELDMWLSMKHTRFSEVQKLQNSIQNNIISHPQSFEKHLNSLSRQLWDQQLPTIPQAALERIWFLWVKIKPELS